MSATAKLISGYQRFRNEYYPKNKEYLLKLAEEGQSPKVVIIACSDSRVDPTLILDCYPGELFVIRNVANLVPPCEDNDNDNFHGTSAALEFAVTKLNVESIIVLGHTQCGGIKALMDNTDKHMQGSFIDKWMQQLENVRDAINANSQYTDQLSRYNGCEQQGIQQSLENLMTFPWVAERVRSGTLSLHGWRYNLKTSELCAMDEKNGQFTKVN
ncbi:carbonate dehydratase [Psychromonas sp. CNPT3]|uniref:carbonic anhydrase n=1 Tax=Psychromonas sp. CNPT3 TaxID=314282 RepID=UPI00006E484F|nr:carbonic anhydrase [Psychromonas sp. CNPT3]AGH81825.1 carbonate dehydratase [Psychromonas sp. CNPT3]